MPAIGKDFVGRRIESFNDENAVYGFIKNNIKQLADQNGIEGKIRIAVSNVSQYVTKNKPRPIRYKLELRDGDFRSMTVTDRETGKELGSYNK